MENGSPPTLLVVVEFERRVERDRLLFATVDEAGST
jgi:hypothetical protein